MALKAVRSEVLIPINRVRPMKGQPRVHFDKDELFRLSLSLKEIGQQKAIEVIALADDFYQIIDGERRWRASKLAQFDTIRAVIEEAADEKTQFMRSVAANFGHQEHTPVEIARAVKRLHDECGMTYAQIAATVAKSEPWVYSALTLLKLDDPVLDMMDSSRPAEQQLRSAHAKEIAKTLEHPKHQLEAAQHIVEHDLTLAKTRIYLGRFLAKHKIKRAETPKKDSHDFARAAENIISKARVISDLVSLMEPTAVVALSKNRSVQKLESMALDLEAAMESLDAVRIQLETVIATRNNPGAASKAPGPRSAALDLPELIRGAFNRAGGRRLTPLQIIKDIRSNLRGDIGATVTISDVDRALPELARKGVLQLARPGSSDQQELWSIMPGSAWEQSAAVTH